MQVAFRSGIQTAIIPENTRQAIYQKARSKMRKLLLAVIGPGPDRKTFSYAKQLSHQMDAQLDVLKMAKTQGGYPHLELLRYLNEHRDVVCTIYDAACDGRRQWDKFRKGIPRNLPVPVVVVQH